MSHPFEVGKTYRNRTGEYVVLAIDGERMRIRYVNAGTLDTSASVQARIWENIQFEEQAAREDERARLAQEARMEVRRRTARSRQTRTRTEFTGFQEGDFEPKKRGIAWSSREELGKILARELTERTKGGFGWWILPRQSEVHVAQKEHYRQDAAETNSALFVAASEESVAYGFRVGKPDGKAKAQWPWSAFVAALSDDDDVRKALRAAMKDHDLSLDVYAMEVSFGQVGTIVIQDKEFLWQRETADQHVTQRMDWEEVVDYLQTVAVDKRCDLYVRKCLPADEAREAGADLSSEIAEVFEALLPLYHASVGA
jgi:hypothetical protein